MPTKEPRLNVVLDKEMREFIAHLAAKRETTLSKVASDLLAEAIELEEDKYWSDIAAERDNKDTVWVPFEEAWARNQKKKKARLKK